MAHKPVSLFNKFPVTSSRNNQIVERKYQDKCSIADTADECLSYPKMCL